MEPKKTKKKWDINQLLSAFLVIAYIICMFFLEQVIGTLENSTLRLALLVLMCVVFGLLLFYATRVGDGKQIMRFSLSVLILMVLPGLYIVLCTFFPSLPLASQIIQSSIVPILGFVMLGYGIPYTFTSGYEREVEEAPAPQEEEEERVPLGSTIGVNLEDIDPEEGDALLDAQQEEAVQPDVQEEEAPAEPSPEAVEEAPAAASQTAPEEPGETGEDSDSKLG